MDGRAAMVYQNPAGQTPQQQQQQQQQGQYPRQQQNMYVNAQMAPGAMHTGAPGGVMPPPGMHGGPPFNPVRDSGRGKSMYKSISVLFRENLISEFLRFRLRQ